MYKYLFLQQRDNSCHITSFANFARLQNFRERAGQHPSKTIDLAKQADLWQSRFEQFPVVSKQLMEWQEAIKSVFSDQSILERFENEKQNGVLCGEHYYANGDKYTGSYNPLAQNFTLNIFEKNFKLIYTPNTLIDIRKLGDDGEQLAKDSALTTLPIYLNKGILKLYDPGIKDYKQVDVSRVISDAITQKVRDDKRIVKLMLPNNKWILIRINPELRKYYHLPENENIILEGKADVLGQEVAFQKFYLPEQFLSYTKYLSSLYDLIVMNLGIDRELNEIDEHHPKYAELQKLRACMRSNPNNPWSFDAFDKKNFIEYQIAEVLKQNPELKELLKKHINFSSFYHPHKYFDDLSKLYTSKDPNSRRKISDMIGEYLPCEELMLAYHMMSMNVTLWGAAKSHNAYMAIQELDQIPGLSNLFKLYGLPGANRFIKSAYKKDDDGYNFVDVWSKIQQKLKEKNPNQKDYVCFCDHGRIISFADDLRYLQEQHRSDHPEILQQLGFAMIDSYYPEQLNAFYRQKNPQGQSLQVTSDGSLTNGARLNRYRPYEYKSDLQHLREYINQLLLKILSLLDILNQRKTSETHVKSAVSFTRKNTNTTHRPKTPLQRRNP